MIAYFNIAGSFKKWCDLLVRCTCSSELFVFCLNPLGNNIIIIITELLKDIKHDHKTITVSKCEWAMCLHCGERDLPNILDEGQGRAWLHIVTMCLLW